MLHIKITLMTKTSEKIIDILLKKNFSVSYSDPFVSSLGKYRDYNFSKMKSIKLNKNNLKKFSAVVLVTDHDKFNKKLILENANLVIDTRNFLKKNNQKIIKKSMKKKIHHNFKFYNKIFDRLFPIYRSLINKGYRKSLDIISEYIDFRIIKIKSGKRLFDWIVPMEWEITDAYIKNKNNKKIVSFKKNNLSVMSYSSTC